jgi:uncharacterized YkwD family protein
MKKQLLTSLAAIALIFTTGNNFASAEAPKTTSNDNLANRLSCWGIWDNHEWVDFQTLRSNIEFPTFLDYLEAKFSSNKMPVVLKDAPTKKVDTNVYKFVTEVNSNKNVAVKTTKPTTNITKSFYTLPGFNFVPDYYVQPTKPIAVEPKPIVTQPTTPIATKPTAPVVTKPAPVVTQPTTPVAETPTTVSAYEKQVFDLTNVERAKAGLKPLVLDAKLSSVARTKSQDMHDKKYFSHTSPTYGSPFDMMKKFGITYSWAAENIAQGQRTPQEVVTAWMNSAGHRANILSSSATTLGVGYVADGNYWTQMFIGK